MNRLREKVSDLIHKEWWLWAATLLKSEPTISEERKKRWQEECFKDYEHISEEMKDLDRMFADKFIQLTDNSVSDRYLNTSEAIKRLVGDYKLHKSLFVAFDFDDTLFDYHKRGDRFPKLEAIIKRAKSLNCKLILFTANEGEKLPIILKYLEERGIVPDFVNENPFMATRKPFYNILLDDRAGLSESYQILQTILDIVTDEYNLFT